MAEEEVRKANCDTALVQSQDKVFLAQTTWTQKGPFSPVVNLIQGIYEREPLRARGILRNRVLTNYPLTEMCKGMIRVAAKDMRW